MPTKEVRNGIQHLESGARGTEVVTSMDEAARNATQTRRGSDGAPRTLERL